MVKTPERTASRGFHLLCRTQVLRSNLQLLASAQDAF